MKAIIGLLLVAATCVAGNAKVANININNNNNNQQSTVVKCYVCEDCAQPFKPNANELLDCKDVDLVEAFAVSGPADLMPTVVPTLRPVAVATVANQKPAAPALEPFDDAFDATSVVSHVSAAPAVAPAVVSVAPELPSPAAAPSARPPTPDKVDASAAENQTAHLPPGQTSGNVPQETPLSGPEAVAVPTVDVLNATVPAAQNVLQKLPFPIIANPLPTNGSINTNNQTANSAANIRTKRATTLKQQPQSQHQCFVMQNKDVKTGAVTIRRGCVRRAATQNQTCQLARPIGSTSEVQACSLCDRDGCNAAGRLAGISAQMLMGCVLMYLGKMTWQMQF